LRRQSSTSRTQAVTNLLRGRVSVTFVRRVAAVGSASQRISGRTFQISFRSPARARDRGGVEKSSEYPRYDDKRNAFQVDFRSTGWEIDREVRAVDDRSRDSHQVSRYTPVRQPSYNCTCVRS